MRTEVLSAAADFTAKMLPGIEISIPAPECDVIAAGHQPELFHPGVWIKHLALSRLATTARADCSQSVAGLNLIVDTDLVARREIRVPTGNRQRPVLESIAFDEPGGVFSKMLTGFGYEIPQSF